MSTKALFEQLLVEFQELSVELSNRLFDLIWHNVNGDWKSRRNSEGVDEIVEWSGYLAEHPPFDLDKREIIGHLGMPYTPTGPFADCQQMLTLPKYQDGLGFCKRFKSIARRAGAGLPPWITNPLHGYVTDLVSDPLSNWCGLLFFLSGQTVTWKEGDSFRWHSELTIEKPSKSSFDAIHICRLCTEQPRLHVPREFKEHWGLEATLGLIAAATEPQGVSDEEFAFLELFLEKPESKDNFDTAGLEKLKQCRDFNRELRKARQPVPANPSNDGYVSKTDLDAVAGKFLGFKTIQNKYHPKANQTGSNNRSLYGYSEIREVYLRHDAHLAEILPETFSEFLTILQSVQPGQ